jgi:hypothetical protein
MISPSIGVFENRSLKKALLTNSSAGGCLLTQLVNVGVRSFLHRFELAARSQSKYFPGLLTNSIGVFENTSLKKALLTNSSAGGCLLTQLVNVGVRSFLHRFELAARSLSKYFPGLLTNSSF